MKILGGLLALGLVGFVFYGQIRAAEASMSAVVDGREVEASESANIVVKIVEVDPVRDDLTEPARAKSRLEQVLDSQVVDSVWPFNFLKMGIRGAVSRGVPANTIVLLLLFPLVASLVAFSRNVVGVKGFGIFTPAVVSVAFLSTGVTAGLILFFAIIVAALLGRMGIRKLGRIPYMPRMAILVWLVSFAVLGLLLASPILGLAPLVSLGIFPVLLFVMLAETFIEVQIKRTFGAAVTMTLETLILSLIAFFVMSSFFVQELVLLNPEISALAVVLVDILIGKYSGLRLLEILRFKELLKN